MSNESSSQTAKQPATALSHRQAVKLAQASAFAHCNDHPYLPQTHHQATTWQPHEWVVAAIHTAALITSLPPVPRFQADVAEWMGECFAPSLYSDMTERGDRLLEEVLELLQAHGYDSARVPTLVNYVFGRPVGEPAQEVGGVMVTLAAYCSVAGLSMQADGQAELDRINQPEVMARIRAKQEAKNALHFDTPLPGSAAQSSPAGHDVRAQFESWAHAQSYRGGNIMNDRHAAHPDVYADPIAQLTWKAWQAALAARQPLGQPVAWMTHHDEPMLFPTAAEAAAYCEDDEQPVPLFRSPAQGVDLAQFRECVELMEWQERGHANPDFPRGDAKKHAEALRLLALIDGHAGREPNSECNRLTDRAESVPVLLEGVGKINGAKEQRA